MPNHTLLLFNKMKNCEEKEGIGRKADSNFFTSYLAKKKSFNIHICAICNASYLFFPTYFIFFLTVEFTRTSLSGFQLRICVLQFDGQNAIDCFDIVQISISTRSRIRETSRSVVGLVLKVKVRLRT